MKFKKIATITLTVLVVGMVALSGIMKLTGNAENAKALEAVGVGEYRVMLGIAEILFAALFAFPKTLRIRFILLSCYFAGALATELSHGVTLNAFVPLALIWTAAIVRDRLIFWNEHGSREHLLEINKESL